MSCPICGANCRCSKRGPGGICCSCHKHKPRAVRSELLARKRSEMSPEISAALDKHLELLKMKDAPRLFSEVGQ
jgi:hypothetical protein